MASISTKQIKFNSDGLQWHQYQQNKQSPRSRLHSLKTKIPQHMTLEIQVLIRDRHSNATVLIFII